MPSSRKHREVHKTKLNNNNNEIVHLKGTVQKLVNVVSDIKYETTNTKETFQLLSFSCNTTLQNNSNVIC